MKNKLAPFIACLSWATSCLVSLSYEFTTWQCLSTLLIVDFSFLVYITNSRINYIRSHWMGMVLFVSIVYGGAFTMVTCLRQYGIVGEFSEGFFFMEFLYQYVSLIASLLLFLVSIIPQELLGRLDDLCWPSTFDDFHIFDNADSWQDDKESQACQHKQ